jgi:hypothetical protein
MEVVRLVSPDAVDVIGGIALGGGLDVHELDHEGRAFESVNAPCPARGPGHGRREPAVHEPLVKDVLA